VLSKLEPLNSSDQLRTSTLVGAAGAARGVGVLLRVAGHGQPR